MSSIFGRLVSVFTALAVVMGMVGTGSVPLSAQEQCSNTGFSDVPADAFYACSVEWMAENGYAYGYDDGTYRPESPASRAQFTTFLWRYLGSNQPNGPVTFPDVPADAYYADAVAWMTENSLLYGFTDGTFRPNENVTRAQQLTFLWRSAGNPEPTTQANFPDTDPGAYYADALSWASEQGLAFGYPDGTFRPHDDVSRGELATFLFRFDGWDPDQPPSNRAPTLAPINDQTAEVDEEVNITVTANDPDNGPENLVFSASGLPGGIDINANTGTMSGSANAPTSSDVTVTVSDGEDETSRSFEFTITESTPPPTTPPPTTPPPTTPPPTTPPPTTPPPTTPPPVNRAPVAEDGDFDVDENSSVGTEVGTVTARDPDGDSLKFSITAGNPGRVFAINSTSGLIKVNGTLNYETTPDFTLTVTVDDRNGNTDTATITINVEDVNEPPVVEPMENVTFEEDTEITPIVVSASDPDGDDLTLAAADLPDGLTFIDNGDETGDITGTPTTPGESEVTVTANDGPNESAPVTFIITVDNVDDAPVVDAIADVTTEVDVAITPIAVSASDPDGGSLTLAATGLPDGLTFTDNGDGTGDIIGTPTTPNTYDVSVTATDDGGLVSDSVTFVITVQAAPVPACHPFSTLACPDLVVNALPFTLDFEGPEGGLDDTGFTLVDPPSNRDEPAISQAPAPEIPTEPDVPGYEPSLLEVAGGNLVITATKGIQYATPDPEPGQQSSGIPGLNALINGLGVAVPTGEEIYELTTTVVAPNFNTGSGGSQQAGLWWFADEDTYIKLVVVRQNDSQNAVQLAVETLDDPTADAADGFFELNGPTFDNGQDVALRMVVDTTTNTVQAFYSVAGAPEELVSQSGSNSLLLPALLAEGAVLDTGLDPTVNAGVFTTKRSATAESTMTASFADFEVRAAEVPNTPPAIEPIADVTTEVDVAITPIPVNATDADGDPVTVTVTPPPAGLTYDDVTSEITGTPTEVGTTTVTVTANDGTDTTTEQFDISVTDGAPEFVANVNFNEETGEQPPGYELDFGEPFGDRGNGLTYGWVEAADGVTPLNLVTNGRDRGTVQPDQRLDTLLHMQADDIEADGDNFNGVAVEGVWEIAVPNDTYQVTVAAGDPNVNNYDNDPEEHALNVEGVQAIAPFVPTGPAGSDDHHETATVTVTVADGLLTIDAFGGTNTKINYIDIAPSDPAGNQDPVISLTGDRTLFDGQDTIIPVDSSDPDGDTVSVTVEGLPAGLEYADGSISGTLGLDASGASPYLVTVTGDDGNGGVTDATFSIEVIEEIVLDINFQSDAAPVPDGYRKDFGEAFGPRTGADQGSGLSYGWVGESTGTPLSLVGNGRDRDRASGPAASDQSLDTLIHMQYGDIGEVYGGTPNCTQNQCDPGAWEIAVPNGLYEVTVSVGDQPGGGGVYDSLHAINVETGLAILEFQASAGDEYLQAIAEAGVEDGFLTINAIGGANTKINYVEIRSLGTQPHATFMVPDNRAVDVDLDTAVSASVNVPGSGVGVNPSIDESLTDEAVKLFEVTDTGEVEVDGNRGSTGGNDTIAISPHEPLKANTQYRFQIDGVLDEAGNTFGKFQTTFITGDEDTGGPTEFEPVEGVNFEKVLLPQASGDSNGKYIASMQVHQGYLWYTTVGQGMYRHEILGDGTLGVQEPLGLFEGRAAIGLVFDENDPDVAWVTHATGNIGGEGDRFGSTLSRVDFSDIGNPVVDDVFINLPRSQKDHLTNSIIYGPSGGGGHNWLYFLQGSNQAAGDVDGAWGNRGETQLTAALLRFDPAAVWAEVQANGPIDVKTEELGGSYDPFAANAPLEIYATGIRNAYDLVWHSNGHIYVPTNGTAGGANSPGVDIQGTLGAGGNATMVSDQAMALTGFGDGKDVTDVCLNRRVDGQPYSGGDVPAIANLPTQHDYLFDVVEGGYYGHPNPTRCEWTLNQGSANPSGGDRYPAGTAPDPNYRGVAYDFITNKSPNGVLDYQSGTFDGKLQNRLMVVRFSNNDDILTMQATNDGEILGAQPGTTIGGFAGGYVDPLEIVEDTSVNPGNIYINQYNRGSEPQQLYLLRVPEGQSASDVTVQPDELIMSATLNNEGPTDTETVTVSNTGDAEFEVTITDSGTNAGDFTAPATVTVPANGDTDVDIVFDPGGTTTGVRTATVDFSAGDDSDTVSIRALAHEGQEGGEEPTLQQVFDTFEYPLDTGWDGLAGGTAGILGDEVDVDLFQRASDGPVVVTPIASFAPFEDLPFGWVAPDGTPNEVGVLPNGQQQTLLPSYTPAGSLEFDPGTSEFGFYYFSNHFGRFGYTEDSRNTDGVAHRARVYPLSEDDYIVAFEDAANGDYQDYVFLLENAAPVSDDPPPPSGDAIKVNFQSETATVPSGYLRDFGEAYGPRTGADQGSGLSYGWIEEGDGTTPLSLVGNGRDRGSNDNQLLDTLMHMQLPADSQGGVTTPGLWEIAIADGQYEVTVAVGDPNNGSAPETHTINVEGVTAIDAFPQSTAPNGSDDRHTTGTVAVEVSDGRLTVDAIGGTNTKINYVDIQPLSGGGEVVAQVNYQPADSVTPPDWVADTGLLFDAGRGYGWVNTEGGANKAADTRDRPEDTDPLDGTLIIVDDAVVDAVVNGTWEFALASGTYTVTASVGDPGFADSTHGITVEGSPLITGFTPAGPGDYQVGTETVEVTDGRLTVESSGTNSKLQWLTIAAQDGTDVLPPQVAINLAGPGSGSTTFTGPVNVTLDISDATLEFVEVYVDGVQDTSIDVTNYDEPFTVSGTGEHTVEVIATDGAGNSTTESKTFSIIVAGDGALTLANPEAVLFQDRLVMSRIESDVDNPKTNETAQVQLGNNGSEDLVITSLDIAGGNFELVGPPTLPLTIPVGGSETLETLFVGVGSGQHQLFESTLTVTHDGNNGPETTIELAGMWQTQEEGGNEPDVAEIVEAFGLGTTIVNAGEQINNQGRLETIGDEMLSQTWERANPSQPITVRQLAAYHTCCSNTATFKWHQVGNKGAESGVLTHDGEWAQTLLPRINGSDINPALTTFTPGPDTFSLSIDPESSDWTLNNTTPDSCGTGNDGCQLGHHLRIWPAEDRDGFQVGDSWIVVMDYSGINYDFNDNVYLVENITPANPVDTTAPGAPSGLTAAVDGEDVLVTWTGVDDEDLAGYVVQRQPVGTSDWTDVGNRVGDTSLVDTSPPGGTDVTYRVVAVDTSGNRSTPSNTDTVTTPAQSQDPIRINTGGGEVTFNGDVYQADAFVTGGKLFENAQAAVPTLYQTEHSATADLGSFSYSIPVENATYTVNLHLAEIYWGATGGGPGSDGGERVFSANIEGGPVELEDYDINAAVGPETPVVHTHNVTVTDGALDIEFTASVNQPKISAIEVIPE